MKRFCLLAVAIVSVLTSSLIGVAADDASNQPPKSIRVAVFDDAGVSDKVAGLIELLNTYSELKVTKVDGNDVRGGKLKGFDVVLLPGGSGSKEAAALVTFVFWKNNGVRVLPAFPGLAWMYALLLYPTVEGRRYSPPKLKECFPLVQRMVSA